MLPSVRIAVRSLLRRPAVAGVAVLSLAIGIGINSAVFGVVDGMFFRPPAVQDAESLIRVSGKFKDSGYTILDWSDLEAIREQTSSFTNVAATMGRGGLWRDGEEMTLLLVDAVSDHYFSMLGVKPAMGRFPDPGAASLDEEPPVVIAHWLWRERMGGRPDVIGQRMEFRDHIWRIAAVLPADFRGLDALGQRHIWIPVSSWQRYFRGDLERGSGQFLGIARLRPGASLQEAQAQLDTLARRIEAEDGRVAKGRRLVAESVGRELRDRIRPGILVLAVVGLVLLIACANVAAVLLAHAESRRREIALRLSLGASRLALLRQFLTESAVLAVAGAGLGLLFGSWLLGLAPALAPPSPVPLNMEFGIDARLLVFTGGCVLVTLLIFGLAPLAFSLRVSLAHGISGARITGRTRQPLLRYGLVTAQVALGVVLAGGAVVLTRALAEARDIYPGYDTSRPLALTWTNVPARARKPAAVLFREAAARVAGEGGVQAVTYARHLPLLGSGSGASISVVPEGLPAGTPPPRVYFNLVGPDYFEVTGARIAAGRPFALADHNGGAPVAIVNAEAARRFWLGQNALGKVLRANNENCLVVGVAADGRIGSLHAEPAPAVFLPSSRMNWGEALIIARTTADPAQVVRNLARAAASTGELRVYQSMTLGSVLKEALYGDWIMSLIGGFLAIVGLLLATGGLYGAVSYATERRFSEFGVRVAVGARASQIAGLVLRQAGLLCAAGVPAGIGLFILLYRYFGQTLLRNRAMDPVAIATGAAITVATVLAGALLPALRAARLDPVEVLRTE